LLPADNLRLMLLFFWNDWCEYHIKHKNGPAIPVISISSKEGSVHFALLTDPVTQQYESITV